MKKLIFLIMIILPIGVNAMSMFGKSEGFRFEDYKKADNAKAELLKMHPIGSPVDDLVKTLEKAGAECETLDKKHKIKPKHYKNSKIDETFHCGYIEKFSLGIYWRITSPSVEGKIDSLFLERKRDSL